MKILHTADIHYPDARLHAEWQVKALASLSVLAETAEREQPALVAIPGDLFDAGIQNSQAAGFPKLLDAIQRILDVCPIVAVSGTPSHDPPGCYAALTKLRGKDGQTFTMIQPGIEYFYSHDPSLLVIGIPELTREWILAGKEAATAEEISNALKDGARSILLGLGALRAAHPDLACLFLFHGPIDGSSMQNGQTIAAGSITIGKDDLRLVASDITAYYGGAAYPKDWGELGTAGFWMADLQPGDTFGALGDIHLSQQVVIGRDIAVTRFDYPHPRRVKFSLPWPEPAGEVEGVQAWICYRVTKEEAEKIDTEAVLEAYIEQGALPGSRVTVELIPTETVRAAEITECKNLANKLLVYKMASGTAETEEFCNGTIEKANQLEREAEERGSTAGMHFRLRRMRLRGAVGIWKGQRKDEIDIDLDKYSPGLIALVGVNGAGKSTLIENMHPYPYMLTRDGKLQDHFRLRDSVRELWFTDERTGTEYRALMEIDGANASGTVKYHLFKNGEPMTNGRKEDYEQAIERMVGSLPLFLRSAFVSQRATKTNPDLSDATKGEKKAIFRELAGLDYLQAYSESAKARAGQMESQVTVGRGQAELLERFVAEELNVDAAIDDAMYAVDCAETEISLKTEIGKALREKVDTLTALVAEQDALGRDIDSAANDAQVKLGQVETARTKIEGYQSALDLREVAQENVDYHAHLKEQEGTENERLSGINKERARLTAEYSDRVKTHRDDAQKLQAAKTKLCTTKAGMEGDHKVLLARAGHIEVEIETPLTENCPKCGQLLPEKKRVELYGERKTKEGQLRELVAQMEALGLRIDATQGEIDAIIIPSEPGTPILPKADETELKRIRAELAEIDIAKNKTTLETAAKAEQEIATLQAQIATLETDAEYLSQHAEMLRARLDPKIRKEHLLAAQDLEIAREAFTEAKEERATAAAKLEVAQKQLAAIEKQKTELEELRASLAKIEGEAAEWRYLEVATGADGIQALELDALGPSIAETANRVLSAAYGNRFAIEFRTTRIGGKGAKAHQIEDFLIWIIDSELGTEQEISTLSGGESVWIKNALYASFGIIRERSTGIKFLTCFLDEMDGALDPEARQKYFDMLEAVHRESGRHQTLVITHSESAQEMISQKITMRRESR